jgi:hypothetical protein
MQVHWGQSAGRHLRLPGDTVISVPDAAWRDLPPDSLVLRLSGGAGHLIALLRREGPDFVGLAQLAPRELVAGTAPLTLRLRRAPCGVVGPDGVTIAHDPSTR